MKLVFWLTLAGVLGVFLSGYLTAPKPPPPPGHPRLTRPITPAEIAERWKP